MRPRFLWSVLGILLLGACNNVWAANPGFDLIRSYGYTQINATTTAPGPCTVTINGTMSAYSSAYSGVVGKAGAVSLTFYTDGSVYGFKSYPTAAAMDADFPVGTVQLLILNGTNTVYNFSLPIPAAPASTPVLVSNFKALQTWPAGQAIAPTWPAIAGASSGDYMGLYAYDLSGTLLTFIPDGGGITPLSTTASFRASSLPINTPLTGDLFYVNYGYYTYKSGTVYFDSGVGFDLYFPMQVTPAIPTIVTQPLGTYVDNGGTFNLAVSANQASTTALSYQWYKDGTAIAGATSSSYQISGARSSDAGNYTVVITEGPATITSNAAKITVGAYDPGRIINLSINTVSGAGSDVLAAGFVVTGNTGTGQAILVRGIGPTLKGFGVPGTLADPTLALIRAGNTLPLAANDDWGGDPSLAAVSSGVGAFTLTASSADSVLYQPLLAPGNYSAIVAGKNGATGAALAEVYDATPAGTYAPSSPRLINVSGRAQVSTTNSLTGGFTIGGSSNLTVLIRASGPALTAFGLSGLAAPVLKVFKSSDTSTPMAINSAWGGTPALTAAFGSVNAFAWSDPTSQDCALLLTLAPGGYSAQVTSANAGSGVSLLEIYEVK